VGSLMRVSPHLVPGVAWVAHGFARCPVQIKPHCDTLSPFACLCGNTTASSLLRDSICDYCTEWCDLASAYEGTSILVRYCESGSRLPVGGPPTASASITFPDREIYIQDAAEFTSIVGCARSIAISAIRSFEAARACDPADRFPCVCGNPTAFLELQTAMSSKVEQGCGADVAPKISGVFAGYCSTLSARRAGVPVSTPATPTGSSRSGSGTSFRISTSGPTSTPSNGPERPGGLTSDGIAGVVVGSIAALLTIGAAWLAHRKKVPTRVHNWVQHQWQVLVVTRGDPGVYFHRMNILT